MWITWLNRMNQYAAFCGMRRPTLSGLTPQRILLTQGVTLIPSSYLPAAKPYRASARAFPYKYVKILSSTLREASTSPGTPTRISRRDSVVDTGRISIQKDRPSV